MPRQQFDLQLDDRTVMVRDQRVSLTPREANVLAYLIERPGQVISRRELEREVFGFSAGVRSETVPVTVRRLRAKLGDQAEYLETIRGTGWRLQGDPAAAAALPCFMTPYHPRPLDEAAVRDLLAAGWRVVTVVGPGGAGKTRLVIQVASSMDREIAYAAVGAAVDEADVLRILMEAVGVQHGGIGAVAAALDAKDALLIVDEAEVAHTAVVQILRGLPEARLLVTSRRTLGLAGEAVHEIAQLEGADARAFLRSRLAASRWGGVAEDTVADRAVLALDGLPLALELIAAHPDPLELSVEDLEAGAALTGAEGGLLEESIARSFARLDPPLLAVLLAMSLCEGALAEEDLRDWLGAKGPHAARELAQRSMVYRQGTGWAVLRTVRSFARRQDADWEALNTSLQAWLVRTAEALLDQVLQDPRRAVRRGTRLLSDLNRGIDHIPIEHLPRYVFGLHRYLMLAGPGHAIYPLLLRALLRAPTNLALRTLALPAQPHTPGSTVDDALQALDPKESLYAVMVGPLIQAGIKDWRVIDALIPSLSSAADRILAQRVAATWAITTDAREGVGRLRDLLDQCPEGGVSLIEVRQSLAYALAQHGDPQEALAQATQARMAADRTGLAPLALSCAEAQAAMLAGIDPQAAANAYLAVSERWRTIGSTRHVCISKGLASMTLAAMLLPEQAWEHLRAVVDERLKLGHAFTPIETVCEAMSCWVEARRGEPGALDRLRVTPASTFNAFNQMGGAGKRIIELFVADVEIMAAPPEERALRTQRLLATRQTEGDGAPHPMLRIMLATLRQRAEAPGAATPTPSSC